MLKEYLNYAIEKEALILIETINDKKFLASIKSFNKEKVFYTFQNQEQGQIWIKNIKTIKFKNAENEEDVRFRILNKKYNKNNMKEVIANFEKYYMEILELFIQKEDMDSQEYKYYILKKEIYENMFQKIATDPENLLLSYFAGFTYNNQSNEIASAENGTTLLLEQSNQSQKMAIEVALTEKISVIEGPPGTGKTTTIINILANLVYRDKKVLIVSKNNSAIDNVVEELDKMDLPKYYIRLGNTKIMEQLGEELNEKVKEYEIQLQKIKEKNHDEEAEKLKKLIIKLNELEKELNRLTKEKSELNELENQLRHIEKKTETYDISNYEATLKRSYHKLKDLNLIRNKIEHLAKILVKISDEEKINIFDKILTYIKINETTKQLEEDGIKLHFALEEKYLRKLIDIKKQALEDCDIDGLKDEVKELYLKDYIKLSKEVMLQSILRNSDEELIHKIEQQTRIEENSKLEEKQSKEEIKKNKEEILKLYPVVMTTVDSILSNYYKYFKNEDKIDYVIIDEASQCDILSALPLLYIARNIIVVGDCKQLSAIRNVDLTQMTNTVEKEYSYFNETF